MLMLTYTWAQPKPTWPQLESNMAQLGHVLTWLGPNMTQLRPVKGNWTPTQAQRGGTWSSMSLTRSHGKLARRRFSGFRPCSPHVLWPQWAEVARTQLGPKLYHVGALSPRMLVLESELGQFLCIDMKWYANLQKSRALFGALSIWKMVRAEAAPAIRWFVFDWTTTFPHRRCGRICNLDHGLI